MVAVPSAGIWGSNNTHRAPVAAGQVSSSYMTERHARAHVAVATCMGQDHAAVATCQSKSMLRASPQPSVHGQVLSVKPASSESTYKFAGVQGLRSEGTLLLRNQGTRTPVQVALPRKRADPVTVVSLSALPAYLKRSSTVVKAASSFNAAGLQAGGKPNNDERQAQSTT